MVETKTTKIEFKFMLAFDIYMQEMRMVQSQEMAYQY